MSMPLVAYILAVSRHKARPDMRTTSVIPPLHPREALRFGIADHLPGRAKHTASACPPGDPKGRHPFVSPALKGFATSGTPDAPICRLLPVSASRR
jgi:hypothetical protein